MLKTCILSNNSNMPIVLRWEITLFIFVCYFLDFLFSDTRRDLCFMKYERGVCQEPSHMLATKSQCCCMVDSVDAPGIAWGPQCEPCPSVRDPKYKELCPHGPGVDHDGGGCTEFILLLCSRFYSKFYLTKRVDGNCVIIYIKFPYSQIYLLTSGLQYVSDRRVKKDPFNESCKVLCTGKHNIIYEYMN